MSTTYKILVSLFVMSVLSGCTTYHEIHMDPDDPSLVQAVNEQQIKDARAKINLRTGETISAVVAQVSGGNLIYFYLEDDPMSDPLSGNKKSPMVKVTMPLAKINSLVVEMKVIEGSNDEVPLYQWNNFFGVRSEVGWGYPSGTPFGGALTYTTIRDNKGVEFGLNIIKGTFKDSFKSSWSSSDGTYNDYDVTHDVLFVGASVNLYLASSMDDSTGTYFIVGGGLGMVSAETEEVMSIFDPFIGPSGMNLPGSESIENKDGSGVGLLLNIGRGKRLSKNVDARIQLSGLFLEKALITLPTVIPVISVNFGYSF